MTLKAVADAAGVSPITVSNVVNGRFQSMGAETRERVEKAIVQLNYRVNSAARSLRHSRQYCVALIVVDQRPSFLSQPAYHQVAAGLSNYLNSHKYALAIEGVSPEKGTDMSFVDRLSTDAFCLLASGNSRSRLAMLERLQASGQPVVVLNERPLNDHPNTCYVRSDDFSGGRLMAEHMIARKSRRVLMLLPDMEWSTMTERAAGVQAVVDEHEGVSLDTLRATGISVAEVHDALERHLGVNKPPDALIAGNDLMAAAAQKFFAKAGYKIPAQVRIGGFGAYEFLQFLQSVISSIHIPVYEMGQVAGQQILQHLANGAFASPDVLLPVELQVGEST
ncbi:LacI family DNA-binding transcriptional regulator [soil metagenome]